MSNDKPPYPYITCKDGIYIVRWGRIGLAFLTALVLIMAGSGVLSFRVMAGEKTDLEMKENIKILGENQQKIDEAQRIQASKTGLMVKQLNALLENEGVTERIEAPPIEPSKLEKLE